VQGDEVRLTETTSVIHPSFKHGKNFKMGNFLVVEQDVEVGNNVSIGHFAAILGPTVIGDFVTIASSVVIGAEGQEWSRNGTGVLREIPHNSGVIIGNRVDIRANTTIQRGVARPTVIGDGTKIGPNCNISHEVRIGRDCLITGMTMIAGSAEIGDRVYMGPQSIVGSKHKIGNDVNIKIGSLVLNDVPDGLTVAGRPAKPLETFKRRREKLKKLLDEAR
jgi:UDP-3-O-[3-hydroxymyristoyl] glucosamine N-acyltransferase